MKERIDDIVAYDELGVEERRALRDAMREDPELRAAFQEWLLFRDILRERIAADFSGREVFVAYVMEKEGLGDVLTAREQELLEKARPAIEKAAAQDSLVSLILERVREDVAAFDEIWEDQAASERGRPTAAEDRKPLRLVKHTPMRWVWRIAAAFLVGAFAVVTFLMIQRDASFTTIATAAGETQEIHLADGSVVLLFEESTLRYQPAESRARFNRQASVSGRAMFDIAADETNFRVDAGNAVITVLGTRFAVETDPEETSVVLASGVVAFASSASPHQQVRLEPGQKSVVSGHSAPTAPEQVDLAAELAWTGQFVFRAERLERIASLLSEFYGVTISVPTQLANERVTGTFDQRRPVHEILRTIASTLGVSVRHDGANRYVFS